jgi:hypothetical protein
LLELRRLRLGSSSWGELLVQSIRLLRYRLNWFGDPTVPLDLSSAVWFSLGRLHWPHLSSPVKSTRRAWPPESFTQQNLASQPQPTSPSHGLPLPSALEEFEVHSPRASRPATFRLQGLATLLTACSLESRAGFVSHRRRSWDLPFGAFSFRKVSGRFRTGRTHLPFRSPIYPHTKAWGPAR